jgi:hypothetical protein
VLDEQTIFTSMGKRGEAFLKKPRKAAAGRQILNVHPMDVLFCVLCGQPLAHSSLKKHPTHCEKYKPDSESGSSDDGSSSGEEKKPPFKESDEENKPPTANVALALPLPAVGEIPIAVQDGAGVEGDLLAWTRFANGQDPQGNPVVIAIPPTLLLAGADTTGHNPAIIDIPADALLANTNLAALVRRYGG